MRLLFIALFLSFNAFASDRILIQPKAGVNEHAIDRLIASHGGYRAEYLDDINVHVVELPVRADKLIQALRKNPQIEFVERDEKLPFDLVVNDPNFSNAWHLPAVRAPEAWDTALGSGVIIAVIDSGVLATHVDLSTQLVAGRNVYENNNDTSDTHGHGTWHMGVAIAAGNNLAGSVGVAFGARGMPVRVSDPQGFTSYSAIAKGLSWAGSHGARVASISITGVHASSTVLSAAKKFRGRGGVVVASAGNSGGPNSQTPSDFLVAVGASDQNGAIASFSTTGAFVDIAAPGVGIFTTSRNGGYSSVSGTSFSAPIVAAVYALVMSVRPDLSPAELDAIVFSTATDLSPAGKDDASGWGIVNAEAAVSAAAQ